MAKTKMLVEEVREPIRTNTTPYTADSDVYFGFEDDPVPNILAGVERNYEEVWIPPWDKECIKMLRIPLYFPKAVQLEK